MAKLVFIVLGKCLEVYSAVKFCPILKDVNWENIKTSFTSRFRMIKFRILLSSATYALILSWSSEVLVWSVLG